MADSVDQFARKMELWANEVHKTPKEIAKKTANTYATAIRNEIGSVTKGGRLRNVGKNGASVGVKVTFGGNDEIATALVRATGPLQIIEGDTKKHPIPKPGRRRRGRAASARRGGVNARPVLYINGNFVTGPVNHPGTKGKHPFRKGVRRVERDAIRVSIVLLAEATKRVFK